jgi:hypothetical protein
MYKIIGANRMEYGPVGLEQLRQWFNEGRVDAETLIQVEGSTGWRPLRTVPELATALGIAPEPAPGQPIPPRPPPPPPMSFAANEPRPGINRLVLAGLMFGVLSLTCCITCVGGIIAVLGLVFSGVGLSQLTPGPGRDRDLALAIIGIVLSLLGMGLQLFHPLFFFHFFRIF